MVTTTLRTMRLATMAAGLATVVSLRAAPSNTENNPTARAPLANATGEIIGDVELTNTPNGVLIAARLRRAPAGVHAFHIHESGKCEAPSFASAGGHFNPTSASHGFYDAKGPHAGDLPNLHIPPDGTLTVEILANDVSLAAGATSLLDADGAALVLHAGADDYGSEPAGDAGRRVACGVIKR